MVSQKLWEDGVDELAAACGSRSLRTSRGPRWFAVSRGAGLGSACTPSSAAPGPCAWHLRPAPGWPWYTLPVLSCSTECPLGFSQDPCAASQKSRFFCSRHSRLTLRRSKRRRVWLKRQVIRAVVGNELFSAIQHSQKNKSGKQPRTEP